MEERSKWFSNEREWWRTLTTRQKLYAAYFLLSFALVALLADGSPLWVLTVAALNLGNSARLVKRVPIDKLED